MDIYNALCDAILIFDSVGFLHHYHQIRDIGISNENKDLISAFLSAIVAFGSEDIFSRPNTVDGRENQKKLGTGKLRFIGFDEMEITFFPHEIEVELDSRVLSEINTILRTNFIPNNDCSSVIQERLDLLKRRGDLSRGQVEIICDIVNQSNLDGDFDAPQVVSHQLIEKRIIYVALLGMKIANRPIPFVDVLSAIQEVWFRFLALFERTPEYPEYTQLVNYNQLDSFIDACFSPLNMLLTTV